MNCSAFITTLVPAIAIAYLLFKFSDLPWTALRIVALLLTVAGIAAVAIARYQLGNSFTLSPQARTLVTHGLYSKIRNPVNIFSAIAIAALFIYINRPVYLVSFLVLIPLQLIRARIESRVLEEKFGDSNSRHYTVRRPVLEDQIAGGSALTPTADHARMAQSRLTRRSWVAYACGF